MKCDLSSLVAACCVARRGAAVAQTPTVVNGTLERAR